MLTDRLKRRLTKDKAYVGEGLRRDEAYFANDATARLIDTLKKRGLPESILDEAMRELAA